MGKALLAALALVAAMLGWGGWQVHTHASVHVTVNDVALKTPRRSWAELKAGSVVLLDGAGHALAHGRINPPYGSVEFSDAAAGDCGRFERQAPYDAAARAGWQACYAAQSQWQAGWAGKVATASVTSGPCSIDKLPVHVRRSADGWLWWVPLPHVGGPPSTHYAFEIFVDSAACSAASPGP